MSKTKTAREPRRQLGQFFTPDHIAAELVQGMALSPKSTVLEPSAGDGAFVLPLIERFMQLRSEPAPERFARILSENIYAVELDAEAYYQLIRRIAARWGPLPQQHNLVCGDFFSTNFQGPPPEGFLFADTRRFDCIVGNPPFGGTIDPKIQDELDELYGERDGFKIKKETYSFFIVKSVELLKRHASLRFICSDTFLTIPTMKGLREFLLNRGSTFVKRMNGQFADTTQPMVVLDFRLDGPSTQVSVDDRVISRQSVNLTGNRSWHIGESHEPYFSGPTLSDYMVASSGMTIGQNESFVYPIANGKISQKYDYEFFDDPITLEREIERARLGHIPPKRALAIRRQQSAGACRRNVRIVEVVPPLIVELPNPDYRYYNKASSDIVYSVPKWAVYWKDDGDAVKTFKKNGNWYLHGVGGMPFFGREGITWQLISPTLNARYLPAGYILDSGAPCGFLRSTIDPEELWFILGWCLAPQCTRLLKEVLNHTRNIQSKDFERLPYPHWVSGAAKSKAIALSRSLVQSAMVTGRAFQRGDPEIEALTSLYDMVR